MLSVFTRAARRSIVLAFVAGLVILCCASLYAAPRSKAAKPIPSDAIILFNGKDLSKWTKCGSTDPAGWKIENGYAEAQNGDICTKQLFTDCQLHLEFWVPLLADKHGQERGNSGVFFMGFKYEVQVLDSYKLPTSNWDCGAIYNIKPADVNACKPPEQWQTYDITFHAPRFDKTGKKSANARITVYQNGMRIHNNVEIPYCTPDRSIPEPTGPGPIELQDHGCKVRYRNVWIRPLPEGK